MKILRALLCGLALLGGLAAGTQAEIRTLQLSADETQLTLVAHEGDVLHYRAEIGELVAMDVQTKEGPFTRLMIPGFHFSQREGAPQLPMMNRLVEIPYGASARIEILSVESRSLQLETYKLFPAQPSMPKNADPETWPFVYDASAYAAGRVAQELVQVVPQGRLRGVDLGRLELSPVEYFPAENRVLVHESVEFRIVFEGADHASGDELRRRTESGFFAPVYRHIDGFRDTTHDDHPDLVRDVVTMVVVTPPEFEAQMQPFAQWKTTRGFQTILAVTGTPEVGTTKEQIQAYIHDLYNNPPEGHLAPSFVIFVGDIAQMPTWTLSGDSSDRPYCDVEGDLVPDIYYGRFSATNAVQLQAILDKTLMYDQFTLPDPSFLGEVVMIAGMDGGYGQVWGNGQINYGTTHYFNEAHGIYSHTYLYPESGSHSADIVQNVSDGVAFINYTAHGSTTAWGNPSFTQGNINGLNNYGKYCTAIGNCCLTSSYEVGECFAETWLRAEDKGAIGYIGASNSTWWDEDYYFGVGYTTNIVEYPVYEDTGIGGYDGLFHDHGEAMDQWYVVNDAIIFSGNLAVMESGSSGTTYYWNIYNLMGDPSIATYLGVPDPNPVVHPETIFTTWTSVTIEAVPGSYVGLTQDGELIGAGMIHESGAIDLPIWAQPLTPGPAHLVVMAQNREPYRADVNIIVPATVYIDPDEIDANVETEISVGVFEYDGVTPRPGTEVWAEGLDYECTHAFTDETGYCTITVTYAYGPTLDIVGQDPAEPWELFRNAITVNAEMWLLLPDLWVTTDIGLDDAFALNLPGTLHASVSVPGHTLWAFQNGEALCSTDQLTLDLTPAEMGDITGIVAVSGYDLYLETFPVIEAYGTLTGHVDADGTPGAGAIVRGYSEGPELIFEVTADAQGNYDVGHELLVATYTITADLFGYLHWESEFFLNYGENVLDIDMLAAPSGVLTGTITDSETGDPLVGTVKVYRGDTMELYAETTSLPDGTYTTPGLPYFDYVVTGKAWHHVAETINLTVDQAVHEHDFVLVPTIGDLLLLDDGSGDRECPAKLDPKTGEVISPAYVRESSKAVADLQADLEAIGYSVTLEPVSGSDPGTWMTYDVLIVCSGNNTNALADAGVRGDLIDFVENEGHLLIEGGEVGYNHAGEADFAQVVLHISDWDHDQSGNVTVADADHYVMSVPNVITGPISMGYSGYGDHDAVDPTPDAVKVGSWTSYPVNASLIAFDPNPAPAGGQIVYYAFNYSVMDADVRVPLLENTITWLMTPEVADCAVSGLAGLAGETTHEGILVEAIPGGGSVITGATGAYTLENLYSGPYTLMATKDGWSTSVVEVYLEPGEHLTGVHHVLYPTAQEETCRDPNAYIGDYQTVTDGIMCLMDVPLTALEVYVNITHTYQGDLTVDIRSPEGTTVRLHDRTGGSTDNIVGWYPGELEPAESLEAFIGESSRGIWTLIVEDHAGSDQGMLNSWCVRLTYPAEVSGAPDDVVRLPLALWANRPNPASPKTVIRFDLPARDDVELSIFDVTGRRVATLLSGSTQAGSHTTVWSGQNDAGQPVAGGLYFYRLRTSERTLTRKMTLLR